MKHSRVCSNVLLAVVAVLLIVAMKEWLGTSKTDQAVDALIASASSDRKELADRVRSQIPEIEAAHDAGRALMIERTRIRAGLLATRTTPLFASDRQMSSTAISLIRYDDRLIAELQYELDRTRHLNEGYVNLVGTYEQELLLQRQVADSYRKRLKRRRLAGIAAGTAVAAVAVAALLKD